MYSGQSQPPAVPSFQAPSRHSTRSESLLSDRLDIDEELRKLAKEQDEFNSRRSSTQGGSLHPKPLNTLSRQTSPDLQATTNADAQWGDPYATAPLSSPPISAASFKSRGSVRSKGSHRAPRKASTPARFEPDREGRPLDSPMIAAAGSSPARSGSPFPFAPSVTSHTDRSFSVAPSFVPVHDDQRSLSFAPSVVPFAEDQRSLSIVPSIAPLHDNDSPSMYQSSFYETSHFDPSVLDFNPTRGLDRNASVASNQTIPRSLFKDFDGVHLSPLVDEEIREEDEEEGESGQHNHVAESILSDSAAVLPPSEFQSWFQQQWEEVEDETHNESGQYAANTRKSSHGEASVGEPEQVSAQPWSEPPPGQGMQYYPAPVPRQLNMPQRLSRQLPPEVMAKRRSQILGSVDPEARKSAIWLAEDVELGADTKHTTAAPGHKRQKSSLANMKNVPPQLRASIFFDHEAVPHQVEMRGGSATATLEHMLDASVQDPIAANDDPRHPDAIGHRRARSSTASMLVDEKRASRASLMSAPLADMRSDGRLSRASKLSGKRSASFDNLTRVGNRSSAALSLSRFSFEEKRNSSALDVDHPALRIVNDSEEGDANDMMNENIDDRASFDEAHVEGGEGGNEHMADYEEELAGDEGAEEEQDEAAAKDEDEYDEAVHGPPTTLLAELQLRKQKLRQRNRTAVSAFPNGIHSTLLEMDTVAQIEKRRRFAKPTTLAWEDPSAKGTVAEVDDDDVPLGVLFPARNGLVAKGRNDHWDQPLGLMQRKDREDNEPLSKRRNRLMGLQPHQTPQVQRRQELQDPRTASPNPGERTQQEPETHDSDHEGETMAQRIRRLRSRRALDDAIGAGRDGAQSRALSGDFASEIMSTFGPSNGEVKDGGENGNKALEGPGEADHEGETLGQRRKRLQAEAAARQVSDSSGERPMLHASPSMANILSQAPQSVLGLRQVSNESRSSGLISDNEAKRALHRQRILDQNFKSGSGMGVEEPLVNVRADEMEMKNLSNSGGPGVRQSFVPGQWSGLRSKSSIDLLREQAATPQPQLDPQAQQSPWFGIAPQTSVHGLGAIGSNSPFPSFPANDLGANFANDPKGGVNHSANRGSMLWQQEQSKRSSMLPRQWSNGPFGFTGAGVGKTYAANAMVQKQDSSLEQIDSAPMTAGQRAKIEQWRTSILR